MTSQKLVIGVLLLLAAALGWWYFSGDATDAQADRLTTTVREGPFSIYATATGELKAKNSVKIRGPKGMRAANIYQTTISDMVTEGTVVEEGGYVAQLDKTELQTKMKEAQTEIDLIQTQLDQAMIDTTIEMRALRDDLVNSRFAREERLLEVEQSKYEPQMVIRQAEIELERSDRDYGQLVKKYELSQMKAQAQIAEIQARLQQQVATRNRLAALSDDFTVMAPAAGMVIYARSWNGKVGPGSQISTWDPVVAELPDLSDMVSKTYVNEVDIAKVRKGQDVKIKVDAFPDKEYTGQVVSVANIGEQLRGYDAKVFEVNVQVNEADSILRPAMTTSNEILTYTFNKVLYVPLEALHRDSLSFVYRTDEGRTYKQEVLIGETNDNAVIIEHGLAAGDEILLTVPAEAEDLPLEPLPAEIKQQIAARLAQEKAEREQAALKKQQQVKGDFRPSDDGGGGGFIIFN